jgi:hypothetical protein
MIFRGALGLVVGTLLGVVVAAGLLAAGIVDLDDTGGAVMQYVATATVAVLLVLPARFRPGAFPRSAYLLLALLATFAERRWLSVWVNLAPLDMGVGPAGRLVAFALPLTGALLGFAIAIDARRSASVVRRQPQLADPRRPR